MPVIRREFDRPFNRKATDEAKDNEERMRRLGMEPLQVEQPPLPEPTSRASRPDLYPAFARGFGSAMRGPEYSAPAGSNVSDVNNTPDDKVATSGADDSERPDGRKGQSDRPRKRR